MWIVTLVTGEVMQYHSRRELKQGDTFVVFHVDGREEGYVHPTSAIVQMSWDIRDKLTVGIISDEWGEVI